MMYKSHADCVTERIENHLGDSQCPFEILPKSDGEAELSDNFISKIKAHGYETTAFTMSTVTDCKPIHLKFLIQSAGTLGGGTQKAKLWRFMCVPVPSEEAYNQLKSELFPVIPEEYLLKGHETNIQVVAELRKPDR